MSLSIGALSARTGVKVVTIRYYEQIGLLISPERTDGRQRRYSEADFVRLLFIRQARELGFEVETIRGLLGLAHGEALPDPEFVRRQLDDVHLKITALEIMRRELSKVLGGDTEARARIVGALAAAAVGEGRQGVGPP